MLKLCLNRRKTKASINRIGSVAITRTQRIYILEDCKLLAQGICRYCSSVLFAVWGVFSRFYRTWLLVQLRRRHEVKNGQYDRGCTIIYADFGRLALKFILFSKLYFVLLFPVKQKTMIVFLLHRQMWFWIKETIKVSKNLLSDMKTWTLKFTLWLTNLSRSKHTLYKLKPTRYKYLPKECPLYPALSKRGSWLG